MVVDVFTKVERLNSHSGEICLWIYCCLPERVCFWACFSQICVLIR